MKKKTIKKRILAGLLAFALIVPANVAGAKTQTVLETNVTEASEGCTMLGVYGSYFAQAKAALAKINEIRKEACEAGNIRDPRNSGRYLQPSDYVPLKWSSDLEYIARIRAAEAGIAFRFMDSGHDRLNEKGTFSIGSNGISSSSEDLAYYHIQDMIEGILLWHSEKQYWVKQDFSEETGHYTSMINPKYTYVGFGGFYSEAAPYPATMAGEFSAKSDLDETMMEAPEDVMQKIEVSNDYIQETYLDGDDQIFTNGTTTVTPRVKLRRNNAIRNVWSMEDVTYTSSDPAVATVTQDGQVTGITNGTVTITAKSGDTIVAQKEITVKCNHPRKITYSYLLKGSSFKAKGLRYRVNAVNAKKGIFDVTCMGSNSKKIKKITVPNYVKYKGIHYRVTGIGKNAFAGCRKVKTVKIQSMYLKKKNIGKNAFRGIPRKASVYVPPGKMKSYRKWLKKAGLKCQGGKKWKR